MTKMHADEVDIDTPLVRRLLAAQFPQWASLPIQPIRLLGTDNAIYRLGNEMVVRLPRRERPSQTLEKELEWLPRLAAHLPFAIPLPKVKGTPAEGYPFSWSVYTWLKGENAYNHVVTDLNQLAVDLAHFIAALQRVNPTGGPLPGAHNFFRGVPLRERDAVTRTAIKTLNQTIDVEAVTGVWEAALRAPQWDLPPVWVHGDLDRQNVLVEQGRLCAVIDFGGLAVGDPACDVMAAWKLFSSSSRDIFRAELSVDESTWMRSRGWAIYQALMALSYYTKETNPTLVREAHRWITETVADSVSM
jgi:aminoglycoside phosphotransferase (APT) family kinase protein